MAVDVVCEIEIVRPRAEVAAYVADPDNATAWYGGRVALPAAPGRSSRIAFVATFLGRRIAYTYEIREHTPGERLQMSTTEGPFPMQTTYTWRDAAADGGTVMTLRNRGEPAGFARISGPLMARAIQRANRKDLRALKTILEQPSS